MPHASPTPAARSRRLLPLLRGVPRIGALSLVATVGLTALPVTGGAPQAKPRPVKPKVVGMALGGQPARTATAADGAEPFADSPVQRSEPANDTILSVGDGAPLVGVTWTRGTAPEAGTEISLRGRTDDGWTDWVTVDVLPVSDPTAARSGKTQRVGTDPAWLGEGVTAVQVRYRSTDHQAVRKGRLELVDPGTSPADAPAATPPASAAAIAARPRIISRAGWGADESMRRCEPDYGTTTNGGFLHHTAGTNSYTASQSAALVRGIYAYHVNGQGWCDIGYNFLVDKYGQVFEGRYGGVDRPVLGAHTLGFNTDTFGVSVLGNYGSTQPSSAALSAVTAVMSWRLAIYYRPGNGSTTYVSGDSGSRYPEGTKIWRPVIMGHRDVVSTSCPGTNLYSKLASLRTSVASKEGYTSSMVYQRWMALGGASGPLGVVGKAEKAQKYGVRTVFASGIGLWQTPSGVRQLGNAFASYYDAWSGPERWGYPVRDSYASAGGQLSDLSGGTTLTWAPGAGTRNISGPIKAYWMGAGGGPGGKLKYPMSSEVSSGTAAGQVFQEGRVYRSTATGTHSTLGTIDAYHAEHGGWSSELRLPVSDQQASGARVGQVFEGGRIYESADTGTHGTLGAIDDHHAALGGWNSDLGLPVHDQQGSGTRIGQVFEDGRIYSSPTVGTHATIGAIDDHHAALGGWNSDLGLPVHDQQGSGTRIGQVFEDGRIYSSPTAGTHATIGAIDDHHASLGGWNSWLGLPTEDQEVDASGVTQQFEGGWMHYDPDTGQVTAHRR